MSSNFSDSNYLSGLSGQTDPTKLQNAYKSLLMSQAYQNQNVMGTRPPGWFIAAGQDKNFKTPYVAPEGGGGGKWICTKLLDEQAITKSEFFDLARAHAKAILLHPNFSFWYLTHAGHLVDRMTSDGYDWANDGKAFFEDLKKVYEKFGYESAFSFYRVFCSKMWRKYGDSGMPSPYDVRFGALRIIFTKWFWKSIRRFPNLARA